MSNGREFNLKLSNWASKFKGDMDALARQTCQEIAVNVVKDTPVDTGFLRSSWQPSIGAPATSQGNGNPDSKVSIVAANVKAGDIFWMTNNAEYGPFVEFGTRRMRGRFFVTRNVKRAKSVVTKLMKELA
jgi:HK97 gp10 family phage protein